MTASPIPTALGHRQDRPLAGSVGWALRPLTAVLAASALGLAQTPTGPKPSPGGDGRTALDAHTEATSRELFSACDGDSDDRLDLFEACDALETLGSPQDSSAFLQLDKNRDGYLQWPEFDAQFRATIASGKTFHVRPCRRFVDQANELQQARKATPLELFIQLHDNNDNGGLDGEEITKIARDIKLLPAFEAQLRMLDVDQSGRVEAAELAPIFEQLRMAVALPGLEQPEPPSGLPAPWGEADSNGDGSIDRAEFDRALQKLDPGLLRWATKILAKLDSNRDGKLSDRELTLPAATSSNSL